MLGPRKLRVVSEVGAAVAGAEVVLLDDLPDTDVRARRLLARRPRASGTTEADGTFLVPADASRAGAVHVRATGFVESIVALEPFPAGIGLVRARNLRFRVIDGSARPIAGATARAVGTTREAEVKTDADGRVELVADGTEWTSICFFADGYTVASRAASWALARPEDPILVGLEGAPLISGRVVAAEDGRPLEGAIVDLVSGADDRGPFATTTTAQDGTFTMRAAVSHFDVGSLRATAPGRLAQTAAWSINPFDPKPFELRLERGRVLDGVTRDATGAAVAGARVRAGPRYTWGVTTSGSEGLTATTTGPAGRFQVRVPSPGSDGSWQIVARGRDGGWGTAAVRDAGTSEEPFVIVVYAPGSIEGRVVTTVGVGVPGVRVRPSYRSFPDGLVTWDSSPPAADERSSAPDPGWASSAVTADDGTFRLGPLPADDLELSLSLDGQSLGRSVGARVLAGKTVTLEPIVLDVGVISGVVLDVTGRPAARVTVRLGHGSPGATWGLSRIDRETQADDAGRFRFAFLDPRSPVSLQAVGVAGELAHAFEVRPRSESFELRLVRGPRLVVTVTRAGRPYDGLLQLSLQGRKSSGPPGKEQISHISSSGSWVTCVAGQVATSLITVAEYVVHVQSVEAESAGAVGNAEIDPADPTTCRVSLELKVPSPPIPSPLPFTGR